MLEKVVQHRLSIMIMMLRYPCKGSLSVVLQIMVSDVLAIVPLVSKQMVLFEWFFQGFGLGNTKLYVVICNVLELHVTQCRRRP